MLSKLVYNHKGCKNCNELQVTHGGSRLNLAGIFSAVTRSLYSFLRSAYDQSRVIKGPGKLGQNGSRKRTRPNTTIQKPAKYKRGPL